MLSKSLSTYKSVPIKMMKMINWR